MVVKTAAPVTMRVKIGDAELEVSGPQSFVEEKVADFVKTQVGRREPGKSTVPPEGDRSENPNRTSTLAQFFKRVSPKSDVDRVLVAAYYLETVQSAQSFTAAELKEAIRREARVPPPTNPSDVIAKNIKKGLMMQAGDKDGRMAYVLTTDGVEFVEQLLKS